MAAAVYSVFFAAILVTFCAGVSGGEYCPALISTFCFGSLPYCCGSASAPNSLHCCNDCMHHYENPCLLSEEWVIVIAVLGGVIIIVLAGVLVYLWCRSRRRSNYKQLDNYNSILAASHPTTGTFALQQRPPGWQPYGSVAMANQSPAYVPEVYSYVQAHPKMYSYGAVGSDDKAHSAPSAPYANDSV